MEKNGQSQLNRKHNRDELASALPVPHVGTRIVHLKKAQAAAKLRFGRAVNKFHIFRRACPGQLTRRAVAWLPLVQDPLVQQIDYDRYVCPGAFVLLFVV